MRWPGQPTPNQGRSVRVLPPISHPATDLFGGHGYGGTAQVYEAFDVISSQVVALKPVVGSQQEIAEALHAYSILRRLHHRNVVQLRGLLEVGGAYWMAMEWVDGVDLETDWMCGVQTAEEWQLSKTDEWPLPQPTCTAPAPANASGDFPRLRRTLIQLAAGLGALHEVGLVHRDVKPSNVLVDQEGRVVLIDVNDAIARRFFDGPEPRHVGTPAFMAPELFDGMAATAASDWYAVGMMLYRFLTGMSPYRGPFSMAGEAKRSVQLPYPSTIIEGIPDDLDQLCGDLLSNEPSLRPTYSQVLQRLQRSSL